MKVWCVDHSSAFSSLISTNLYLTEEEAEEKYNELPENCYRKKYIVTDIWGWTARNFKAVLDSELRKIDSFKDVGAVKEKIEDVAKDVGITSCVVLITKLNHNETEDYYIINVSWIYDGLLYTSNNIFTERTDG